MKKAWHLYLIKERNWRTEDNVMELTLSLEAKKKKKKKKNFFGDKKHFIYNSFLVSFLF